MCSSSTLAVTCPRLVLLIFHFALCSFSIVAWPQMIGIMAVMDQRDSFVAKLWVYPQLQFIAGQLISLSWCRGRFPWS